MSELSYRKHHPKSDRENPSDDSDAQSTKETPPLLVLAIVFACSALFLVGLMLSRTLSVWVTTTGAAFASLALLLAFARNEVASELQPSWRAAGWGVVAGVFCVVATKLIYPVLTANFDAISLEAALLYAKLQDPPGPMAALPALVFIVFVEEIVWRGVLTRALSPRVHPALLAPLAALTYTLPQLGSESWLLAIVALVFGLFLSSLRLIAGNLSATLMCHLVWNLGVFILYPLEGT